MVVIHVQQSVGVIFLVIANRFDDGSQGVRTLAFVFLIGCQVVRQKFRDGLYAGIQTIQSRRVEVYLVVQEIGKELSVLHML